MKPLLLICAVSTLLSGCATEPIPTNAASPIPATRIFKPNLTKVAPGSGSLIVKRDIGITGSGCTYRLYVNGEHFADIESGEKVQIYLIPGEHIIGSATSARCFGGNAEAAFTLREGQTRSFRVSVGASGETKLQPTAF